MATLIPRSGETVDLECPASWMEVQTLLGMPFTSGLSILLTSDGCVWVWSAKNVGDNAKVWGWVEKRGVAFVNRLAKEQLAKSLVLGKPACQGSCLFLSRAEYESMERVELETYSPPEGQKFIPWFGKHEGEIDDLIQVMDPPKTKPKKSFGIPKGLKGFFQVGFGKQKP